MTIADTRDPIRFMVSAETCREMTPRTSEAGVVGGAVGDFHVGIAVITVQVAEIASRIHAGGGPVHLVFIAGGEDRPFRRGAVGESSVAFGTISGTTRGVAIALERRTVGEHGKEQHTSQCGHGCED